MTNKVGRPRVAEPCKRYSVRLNNAHVAEFKHLGGAKWLKAYLNESARQRVEFEALL